MDINEELKKVMIDLTKEELEKQSRELEKQSRWYRKDVQDALYYMNKYTYMEELYDEALFGKTIPHKVGKVIRFMYHAAKKHLQIDDY